MFLSFAPINAIDANNEVRITDEVALETMIYWVTKREKFIGLFEKDTYSSRKKVFRKLADLLQEHIEQITSYFESFRFRQYQSELLAIQHEYNELLIKRYVPRGKVSPF